MQMNMVGKDIGTDMNCNIGHTDEKLLGETLSRVCLGMPIPQLMQELCTKFDLGAPETFEPIQQGYQDLNVLLRTAVGRQYVIKVFSKRRTLANIRDQVQALTLLRDHAIAVPNLVHGSDNPLIEIPGASTKAYAIVMDYFDGPSLEEIPPHDSDIVYLAGCLSRMHQLPLNVSRYYDDWGAANLAKEFEEKHSYLSANDLLLVKNVVERFKLIVLSQLHQCAIHGDLYRAHVLKNDRGEYCMIDFGCMDFNAAVLDLAIFIAHVCLDSNLPPAETRRIYHLAVNAYCMNRSITAEELSAVPILVAASYAAYIVATSSLIVANNDHTMQTQQWLATSRAKLTSFLQAGVI